MNLFKLPQKNDLFTATVQCSGNNKIVKKQKELKNLATKVSLVAVRLGGEEAEEGHVGSAAGMEGEIVKVD